MASPPLKILIIEDNDDIRQGWLSFFQAKGHQVCGVALASKLPDELLDFVPDIYVIDLNLPDADGLDLVRQLRRERGSAGIVITTARSQIGDKLVGYECGADNYFTKPVDPAELLASIVALGSRLKPSLSDPKALRLYAGQHALKGQNGSVDLSPNESMLLAGLARAAGQPLARWELAGLLGTASNLPAAGTLEMRIARLRKKLIVAGAEPPGIRAVYGRGYVLSSSVLLY